MRKRRGGDEKAWGCTVPSPVGEEEGRWEKKINRPRERGWGFRETSIRKKTGKVLKEARKVGGVVGSRRRTEREKAKTRKLAKREKRGQRLLRLNVDPAPQAVSGGGGLGTILGPGQSLVSKQSGTRKKSTTKRTEGSQKTTPKYEKENCLGGGG